MMELVKQKTFNFDTLVKHYKKLVFKNGHVIRSVKCETFV